ncbi:MAG: hypothetical protein F6K25_05135 [Okeania sp. SIO2G4]|uniref:hypothetical protein n=1 Tax=unclassified Okeania TaxID=2634635 RepID=UPI0013B872CA|nr:MULTISPECIES: hypothetical protein [unclassified Okeania]NEP03390.1 hypothetical protein [Okeania sp. SIO4D6]NEP37927.1 hypothetical protein [Okeania sp. SIO2H7]NEP71113.1 hypothetical protein [Okeania sp. SIO2G5]NEP92027.1 hypothetical protein [Okeania sp. SIO2F5]NEQ90142.1 hypothetical protein [Okeania sp. SIO2G4]
MKLLSILILLSITTTVLALVILSFPWRHPLLTNLQMKSLLGGFRILWGIYLRGKYSYTQVTVIDSEKYVLPTTLKEFADTEKKALHSDE